MMSPEEYIEQRLNDQIVWYDRKSQHESKLVQATAFCGDCGRCHNSIPLRLRRPLVFNQDCDRRVGHCRCRDRIPPWTAATSGTLDRVSSYSGVAQKGEISISDPKRSPTIRMMPSICSFSAWKLC